MFTCGFAVHAMHDGAGGRRPAFVRDQLPEDPGGGPAHALRPAQVRRNTGRVAVGEQVIGALATATILNPMRFWGQAMHTFDLK